MRLDEIKWVGFDSQNINKHATVYGYTVWHLTRVNKYIFYEKTVWMPRIDYGPLDAIEAQAILYHLKEQHDAT